MRQVVFKQWIPRKSDEKHQIIKGTGKYSDNFSQHGKFHQWASDYEEFETGPGNYTVALIELPGGTIEKVLPENIKFIS